MINKDYAGWATGISTVDGSEYLLIDNPLHVVAIWKGRRVGQSQVVDFTIAAATEEEDFTEPARRFPRRPLYVNLDHIVVVDFVPPEYLAWHEREEPY